MSSGSSEGGGLLVLGDGGADDSSEPEGGGLIGGGGAKDSSESEGGGLLGDGGAESSNDSDSESGGPRESHVAAPPIELAAQGSSSASSATGDHDEGLVVERRAEVERSIAIKVETGSLWGFLRQK